MTNWYKCSIRSCTYNNQRTNNRKFIFVHYLKHLRRELNEVAKELNISNPYFENRYSLINHIINNSMEDSKLEN